MQNGSYKAYNMNHLKDEALKVGCDGGIKLGFHGK